MRRLFLIIITVGVAALSTLFAAPYALSAPTSNISKIAFDESSFDMLGCEGDDSILTFTFSSTGSGKVTVFAATETGELVGQVNLKVDSSSTEVRLPIIDGYVGLATIRVEAENYPVKMGQKADQTAANQIQKQVGLANCAMWSQNPQALESQQDTSSFWNSYGVVIIVLSLAVIFPCVAAIIALAGKRS